MTYLVVQMWVILAVAVVIGAVIGWILRGRALLASGTIGAEKGNKEAAVKAARPAVEDIEGVGKAYGKKLRSAGIRTTDDLYAAGQTVDGRKAIARLLQVEPFVVAKWVSMADMMRIQGVASKEAELLVASGLRSHTELAKANGKTLSDKMKRVNDRENIVRQVPGQDAVDGWVEQAKGLGA